MKEKVVVRKVVVEATKESEVDLGTMLEKLIFEKSKTVVKVRPLKAEAGDFEIWEVSADGGEKEINVALCLASDTVRGMENTLSMREKVVLKKKYEEGKKLTEIAFDMGITPQAVVSFLKRIKGKIWGQFAKIYSSR